MHDGARLIALRSASRPADLPPPDWAARLAAAAATCAESARLRAAGEARRIRAIAACDRAADVRRATAHAVAMARAALAPAVS